MERGDYPTTPTRDINKDYLLMRIDCDFSEELDRIGGDKRYGSDRAAAVALGIIKKKTTFQHTVGDSMGSFAGKLLYQKFSDLKDDGFIRIHEAFFLQLK